MVTATTQPAPNAAERLGPAERIVQTLLACSEHLHHDRRGAVFTDPTSPFGVKWVFVTHAVEPDGTKVVYRCDRPAATPGPTGKRGRARGAAPAATRVRLGVLRDDLVEEGGRIVARYQPAGLFPDACAWMYRQVAEVWKLDNEFAARW